MATYRLVVAHFHETDEYIASTLPGPVSPPDEILLGLTVDSSDEHLFHRLVAEIREHFAQQDILIDNLPHPPP